jgi:16S rRNA (cytosine1402-N4)-methyltransferase
MNHTPVMATEVVDYLLHENSRLILDATVGNGGHTMAILRASRDVCVLGVDRDPEALRETERVLDSSMARVRLVRANYADLDQILPGHEKVDGALADLGVSSMQLDRAERGFSHSKKGPLDMRMSDEGRTAKAFLETVGESELTNVLRQYGEVTGARRIARAIAQAAREGDMNTTTDLKNAVDSAVRGKSAPALLSRVFQAVRIAVNDELRNLERFLSRVVRHLHKDGRIVMISYHSLEDRLIKSFFKRESTDCICPPAVPVCKCDHRASVEVLTPRVVRPSSREVEHNPRARSARLRAARVLS